MDHFRPDGHLTEEALAALAAETPMEELARLEMAEHLAFCDFCLQRYTETLTESALLIPAQSCQETLWQRIRWRAMRLITNRYATAAAAIALALTMLWGGLQLPMAPNPDSLLQQAGTTVADHVRSLPERWDDAWGDAFSRISGLFDQTGATAPDTQGGTNS